MPTFSNFMTLPNVKERTRSTKSFLALWNLNIWLEEKMLLVIIFVAYDSQQFQMCIGKNLIASIMNFQCPRKNGKKPKNSKIVILAPFSVINSWNEIWSPKHDKKIFWQEIPKTLLYQLVKMRKCRLWDIIVDFRSLSPKMGQKWQCLRVLRVLPLFGAIRN